MVDSTDYVDGWDTARESDQATVVENTQFIDEMRQESGNDVTVNDDENIGASYVNVNGSANPWDTAEEEDRATNVEEEGEEDDLGAYTTTTEEAISAGAQEFGDDWWGGDEGGGGKSVPDGGGRWENNNGSVEEEEKEEDDETTPTPQEEARGGWGNAYDDGGNDEWGNADGGTDGWGNGAQHGRGRGQEGTVDGRGDVSAAEADTAWGNANDNSDEKDGGGDDSNEAWNTANEDEGEEEDGQKEGKGGGPWGTVREGGSNVDSAAGAGPAWATVNDQQQEDGDDAGAKPADAGTGAGAASLDRRASEWSMKGHGACVVDFYADDDLNGDHPHMQLQIVKEADEKDGGEEEEEEEEGRRDGGDGARKKFPPRPLLVDQGIKKHFFDCVEVRPVNPVLFFSSQSLS